MAGTHRTTRCRGRDDTGAQLVEFALIVPVLLIIVLGVINFGYLFGQQLSLNQAVREGARKAVVSGFDSSGETVSGAVWAATGPLIKDQASLTVTAPPQGCKGMAVGSNLVVDATYATAPPVPWVLPALPQVFTLSSKAVFRCEWGL